MKLTDLPSLLPLYSARSTVLLPRAQIPLVFNNPQEKRLVDVAFRRGHRLIGMVQSNPEGGYFQKGCVGKIISFQEGNPLFITLSGICRFQIDEVIDKNSLKFAKVSYANFQKDLEDSHTDPLVDRTRLLSLLKIYLEDQQIATNWDEISHASDELIISSLAMVCPFKPIEKQALLEISTLAERCNMMIALMEMAAPNLKGHPPILH